MSLLCRTEYGKQDHRAVYSAPCFETLAPDVGGSHHIGMGREATLTTQEITLARTVLLGAMPTSRTGARGVRRIDEQHRNPGSLRFIGYQLSQLVECPGQPFVTLALSDRAALVDISQLFQRECLVAAPCFVNQLFADVMVHPRHKPGLFATDFLQMPLRRLRAFVLKALSQPQEPAAALADLLARIGIALTVDGDIDDTQVNSENIPALLRRG